MKFNVIGWTEKTGAFELDSFDTADEAILRFKQIIDPNSLNPFYNDLVKIGGYIRLETDHGDEFQQAAIKPCALSEA